ncbi:hypothetical protein B0H17DRAFT_1204692 [Mycena rosella]|uniref:Uncharacterized protein n=1 Tax=Mycena rosella TaxID=1033263 RepID=A0AAD7GEY5_MYCRO|nr:hypothetical protein B0H17DRAFT_1204692 [Mycena rosella]
MLTNSAESAGSSLRVCARATVGMSSFWILLMAALEIVSFTVLAGFMMRHQVHVYQSILSTARVSKVTIGEFNIVTPAIVQYRGIVLRIGLYPFTSCVLNFSGCVLALYLSQNRPLGEECRRLSVVDICIFSIRPPLYALIASTDPMRPAPSTPHCSIPNAHAPHSPSSARCAPSAREIFP